MKLAGRPVVGPGGVVWPGGFDGKAELNQSEIGLIAATSTVIGKGNKQAVVSLTERKPRLALDAKVSNREARGVKDSVLALLRPLAAHLHTITSDNGKEFARH